MSGFEIFGAAAGSLVLAQQIVGSLRWGKEEYDTWKRAGHEMKELLTNLHQCTVTCLAKLRHEVCKTIGHSCLLHYKTLVQEVVI